MTLLRKLALVIVAALSLTLTRSGVVRAQECPNHDDPATTDPTPTPDPAVTDPADTTPQPEPTAVTPTPTDQDEVTFNVQPIFDGAQITSA